LEAKEPARWIWWANWLGIGIGVVALAFILDELGWSRIVATLRDARGGIAIAFTLGVIAVLLRARALHLALRPSMRMVHYGRVVAAQAAGSAIADLTPTGALGDATKATTLLGRVPAQAVVGAIVTYDVLGLYAGAAIITVGLALGAAFGILPPPYDRMLWASAALLVVTAVVVAGLVKRGMVRTALDSLVRLKLISPARRESWATKLQDLDSRIRGESGGQRESFALLVVARLLGWVETYVLLRALGVDVSARLFVALNLGGTVVSRIASFLPLGVGVGDAGTAALFQVLGLPPVVGVELTLLRRVRAVLLAGFGFAAWLAVQTIDRVRIARGRARIRAARLSPPPD
jgi:uncharacterized protein (TIRG00374 family)